MAFLPLLFFILLVVGIIFSAKYKFFAGVFAFSLLILNVIFNSISSAAFGVLYEMTNSFMDLPTLSYLLGIFSRLIQILAFGILVIGLFLFLKKKNVGAQA